MKIELKHDVFNISKRIKKIDKDYYVVYNTESQKFEIHNSSQIGASFCLNLPYESLDERTLWHVLQTRSGNIDKILEQIENENKLKESAEISSTLSNVYDSLCQEEKE